MRVNPGEGVIVRQHAQYAERDIVLPIPSVRLSVCLSNAGTGQWSLNRQ